jgi:hypothetical protein
VWLQCTAQIQGPEFNPSTVKKKEEEKRKRQRRKINK